MKIRDIYIVLASSRFFGDCMDISRRALRYPDLSTLIMLFACLDESWTMQRVWAAMQAFAGVFRLMMPGRAMSYQSACAPCLIGREGDLAGRRLLPRRVSSVLVSV